MNRFWTVVALGGLLFQPLAGQLSDEIWEANKDLYEQILDHPFLKDLADGTLSQEAFGSYIIQDTHYLHEFAHALKVTASKAPKQEWADLLNTHSAETLSFERQLHEDIFNKYQISSQQISRTEPSPEAFAYTNFLVATAYSRPFAESMAALLPCYWIYWEVGKELEKNGSKNPVYQSWIETYSSQEYGESVQAVLDIFNEVAQDSSPDRLMRMKKNFRRSTRYEWMFWDSAYYGRPWPPNTDTDSHGFR